MSTRLKRICVVIGNGFSIGLNRQSGLYPTIDATRLLPPPAEVEYLPLEGDCLPRQHLWQESLFPTLWKDWQEFCKQHTDEQDFLTFSRHVAKAKFFHPTRLQDDGFSPYQEPGSFDLVDFFLHTTGYEFRAYLWTLFRYHDTRFRAAVTTNPSLYHRFYFDNDCTYVCDLVRDHLVDFVSYNYDCNLENMLVQRGIRLTIDPTPTAAKAQQFRPSRQSVQIVKPHGSLAFYAFNGFTLGPHPWLCARDSDGNPKGDNWIWSNIRVNPLARYQYPPVSFPPWPDLVPPGHAYDHLAIPFREVQMAARTLVDLSDVIVVHGLSGREPDNEEIAALLGRASGKTVIHVDQDHSCPTGTILRREVPSQSYHPIGPDQMAAVARIAAAA